MAKTARKVKNLRRKYDNVGEFNINKYQEINPHGVLAIKRVMKEFDLQYGCKLEDVTYPLVRMYNADMREIYEINTTGQVIKILNYIKDNDLLKEGV